MINDLFDGLAFGVLNMSKSELSEIFAKIKFNYNKINNKRLNKDLEIYYCYSFLSGENDDEIYQIVIDDKKNKRYWMGYICNPIFDFDSDYISGPSNDVYLTQKYDLYDYDDDDNNDDGDEEEYNLFVRYVPYVYNTKYKFDEELKKEYFPNN